MQTNSIQSKQPDCYPCRFQTAIIAASVFLALACHTECAHGSPKGLAAKDVIDDSLWTSIGGLPGPDGKIHSIVADQSGNVYVGGSFTDIGTVKANGIAMWKGGKWSPLGTGIDGRLVLTLAVSGTDLYAGGWFENAGGTPANNVAKWDGKAWSPLGKGVDDVVFALAVSGTNLYAGGIFTMAGGEAIENIAKWDGTSWSALGSGTDNWVESLAVSGTDLYAGGFFTKAGDIEANHIAKWNGTTWSPLGSGVNDSVLAFGFLGTDVYAGGEFTMAGGKTANRIAKWDGKAWSPVGAGADHWVLALALAGGDLYAGGTFTNANGTLANHIAKWDGKAWSALGSGIAGGEKTAANTLAISGTNLYVGGNFTTAGGKVSINIAQLRLQAAAPLALALLGIVHNRSQPDQPFTLSWRAAPGSQYQIQTTADLNQPWTPLLATPRIASAIVESFQIPGPMRARAFFRIVQLDTKPTTPPGMALIPAGPFQMGDSFDDVPRGIALPVHTVHLSAFYIDQFDVTKDLWTLVYRWALINGYKFDNAGAGKGPNHPIHSISWYDAIKWCNARSEMEGRVPAYYTSAEQITVYRSGRIDLKDDAVKWNVGYRLPTEAEWEKAARGGLEGRRFPWGDTITHDQANYQSSSNYSYDLSQTSGYHPSYRTGGEPYTSPVGSFAPNGYGLYDMAGNAWQWCWDRFSLTYYADSSSNDPRGPDDGTYHSSAPGISDRVWRGGLWAYFAINSVVAGRLNAPPDPWFKATGFRTVLPPSQP